MKDKIELLERQLERERKARKQAESILEQKALELYKSNQALLHLNSNLEVEIQKRTTKLQESEQRYRHLVENASDIIYNVDEEGYFTYINWTGLEKFGYDEPEILGKRYTDFIPEAQRAQLFNYYTDIKQAGVVSDYQEFQVLRKDGVKIWVGQNVNRINREDGTFYYSAVARNITDRKQTEIALEKAKNALVKSEIKYRSIIENMDLGLLEVDTKGTIIRVYDGFNQMTGYEGNELVGKDAKETLLVEGYESVIDEQENNRLKGKTNVYEVKIKKKNGTEIYVLISGAPFYNEKEEIIGSIGIHYDISERKQLEQDLEIAKQKAIKAQQAEEQFLANMSHEIRTPLNAIIGMSHLLAETDLDQNQTEFLDILSNSASILKNLISDILDISKINAGVLELQGKPVDLKELTHTLITTFNMKNIEKEVQFLLDFDPQIDHYIISDPQLINQVLINLLNNAEKFTEQGKISLIVKLIEDQEDYYELKVEVQDTGVGIAPENIEKIFQQFKQASGEIRSKYGGTGLGLTISHRFIALLGGNLEVNSIIGEGSNFYFTIKVEKGAKIDEQKKIKTATQQLIPQGEEIQLLVVEDNPMNLKYLTTLLRKWNIQHEVASNGVEAVDLYGQQHFDMILMDLQMPKMDGYEATRIIRSMPEGKREVSIIALTASTFLSKKRLALQAGMTDFLSKPFTPDQLAKVISDQYNFSTQSMEDEHDFLFDSALDQNYLQNAYGSDMNYALDMFETFLEIIEKEMNILEASIKDGTAEGIRKQAHKIKPTFTMVGLTALSDQIKTIEELSQTATKDSIQNEFENVKTALHKMLPILRKEKERLQANK